MTGIELAVIAGTAFTVGDAALAIGAVTTALSTFSQMSAQQESSEFNAKQSAEKSAQVAVETDQKLKQQKRENFLRTGRQFAASAESGGDVGGDFNLFADTAAQNQLELNTITQNGMFEQEAIAAESELDAKRTATSPLGVAGAVLSVGTTLAGLGTKK